MRINYWLVVFFMLLNDSVAKPVNSIQIIDVHRMSKLTDVNQKAVWIQSWWKINWQLSIDEKDELIAKRISIGRGNLRRLPLNVMNPSWLNLSNIWWVVSGPEIIYYLSSSVLKILQSLYWFKFIIMLNHNLYEG